MGRRKKDDFEGMLKAIFAIIICIIVFVGGTNSNALNSINNTITEFINGTSQQKVTQNLNIVETTNELIKIDNEKLNVIFFDVGQADSQLITFKNKTLLIDAGNVADGELLVNAIKNLGINKLDYVIGTHVHEDHIGGMSKIIDNFEIGKFYLPYNTISTNKYYERLLLSLTNKNESIEEAIVGEKIYLDDISCEIMSVDNSEPENTNASSIVVELVYNNQKFLFMGDAEKENEISRKWNDIDVLKVGHHGSNTSSSNEFLNQVLPEISIISVGKNNTYGLPKKTIIDRLNEKNSKIYRTDEDGTIQIICDGQNSEVVKIDLSFDGNK